ncbi:hypothetical protein RFI_01575 [Reticulomyxa filosa]|uniref:Uncharacterized protein n=1 Tax=Reticulomyxa filosa TaxID=46433 RepID=X6PAD5_RETFI|nr:hypothetical protein RFI_01575 [Reticulomyxa filosa]|eukprot:ETO35490.1 hypothetical protein RFI_01575 [Reticulomyxa filosa]
MGNRLLARLMFFFELLMCSFLEIRSRSHSNDSQKSDHGKDKKDNNLENSSPGKINRFKTRNSFVFAYCMCVCVDKVDKKDKKKGKSKTHRSDSKSKSDRKKKKKSRNHSKEKKKRRSSSGGNDNDNGSPGRPKEKLMERRKMLRNQMQKRKRKAKGTTNKQMTSSMARKKKIMILRSQKFSRIFCFVLRANRLSCSNDVYFNFCETNFFIENLVSKQRLQFSRVLIFIEHFFGILLVAYGNFNKICFFLTKTRFI